jgi:glutamine amidotransferase
MARLIGIVTRQPVDISLSLGQPQNIMFATHGWGTCWYEKKKITVLKGIRSAVNPNLNQPVQITALTRLFMFHMRQATSGDISEKNTHPFTYNNYSFAHIGSVNKELLLQSLTAPFISNFQSDPIDSEVYFRSILQQAKNGDIVGAIRNVTQQVNSDRGANFLLSDGETLYAYRFGLPLYWMRWNQQSPFTIQTATGLTLSSAQLASNPAYIISSEKVCDGYWTALDEGELFIVERNLQYNAINLIKR